MTERERNRGVNSQKTMLHKAGIMTTYHQTSFPIPDFLSTSHTFPFPLTILSLLVPLPALAPSSATISSNTNSSFFTIAPMPPVLLFLRPPFSLTPLRSDPWYWYPCDKVCWVRARCAFEKRALRAGIEAHQIPIFISIMDQVFMGTESKKGSVDCGIALAIVGWKRKRAGETYLGKHAHGI
jgi:hypothetical protein